MTVFVKVERAEIKEPEASNPKPSRKDLTAIVADYGFPRVTSVRDVSNGAGRREFTVDTAKGRLLVKIEDHKSELEVKRELDFVLFLRKLGFPCFVPLADKRGQHHHDWFGRPLSVYRPLEGHAVAPGQMTFAQLENVGRVLGDLHLHGKAYKKGTDSRFSLERVADVYLEARTRLPSYFKRTIRTLDAELDYLNHYLEAKLPKGIIHGEMFPEKIRFKGDRVVAVLDFEAASRGKFIFDLANAVNFLCFVNERYSLERFEALVGGYESLRTLSLAEWDAFPNELRFSAFRFAVTQLRRSLMLFGDDRSRLNRDFQEFYTRLRILRREQDGGMEPMLMAMATGYDYRKYQRVKAFEKRSR
jgi:homoserine kinase type II